jgi:uncharacterized protein DUF6283
MSKASENINSSLRPAPAPCRSCPYRRDVPAGIWDVDEYEKLPPYDRETGDQPTGLFMCHSQDGRICAGWCGTHDMNHALAVRLACAFGHLDAVDLAAVLDYESPVPLFASGAEAAAHGLAGIGSPSMDAIRAMDRIRRKHGL